MEMLQYYKQQIWAFGLVARFLFWVWDVLLSAQNTPIYVFATRQCIKRIEKAHHISVHADTFLGHEVMMEKWNPHRCKYARMQDKQTYSKQSPTTIKSRAHILLTNSIFSSKETSCVLLSRIASRIKYSKFLYTVSRKERIVLEDLEKHYSLRTENGTQTAQEELINYPFGSIITASSGRNLSKFYSENVIYFELSSPQFNEHSNLTGSQLDNSS